MSDWFDLLVYSTQNAILEIRVSMIPPILDPKSDWWLFAASVILGSALPFSLYFVNTFLSKIKNVLHVEMQI